MIISRYKRDKIMAVLAQNNPNPTTELDFDTPFQLLIAVMLSAQATDIGVNKATKKLFGLAPDVYAMQNLGEEKIRECIRSLGLFNTKAKNAWLICDTLIKQHSAQVPKNREALEALPGVGRKTANVILNTAFGEPTIAVDTHVFRVSKRIGFAKSDTVEKVEQEILVSIPKKYLMDAHHWLILHGRYICKARKPECHRCPIQQWCPSKTEFL